MGGRPSDIDKVVDYHEDDEGHPDPTRPITKADVIVDALRDGLPFELACAVAGIDRDTGYEWRKVAARARTAAKGLPEQATDLTAHQRRCIAFSDAARLAEGAAAGRMQKLAERLMVGGIPLTKTVTRVRQRKVGETVVELETVRTTTTEETLPDGGMIRWWFTHRFPRAFMPRLALLDGSELLDEEEYADALGDSLEAYLAGREEARQEADEDVIDVVAVDHSTEVVVALPRSSNGKRPRRRRDEMGRLVDGDDR